MKKLFRIQDRMDFQDHLSSAQRTSFEKLLLKTKLSNNAQALSVSTGDGVWDYISFKAKSEIKSITATDIVENPLHSKDIDLLNSLGNWDFVKVKPEQKLPFDSNKFDLIYHVDVIEHVEKPFLFLAEQYRVLKKNGYIIVNTPNLLRPANLIKLFLGKLYFPCDIGSYEKIGAYIHIQEFTEWTLIQMLKEIGFKRIEVAPVFFGIYPFNLQFSSLPRKGVPRLLCHCLTMSAQK